MVQFEFEGIDYWSRPVFKATTSDTRIGSLDILFPNKEIAPNNTKEEITNYFKNNKNKLYLFGDTFDEHDPLGSKINPNKFEII